MNVLPMTTGVKASGGSQLKLVLWALVILLCVLAGVFAVKFTTLKLRVAFADGQIRIFEQMKVLAADTTDPRKLSGLLQYVVDYYPSGSKHVKGSQLDRVVETARSNAVTAIITRLRATTGKDLGSDCEKWLKEYPPDTN